MPIEIMPVVRYMGTSNNLEFLEVLNIPTKWLVLIG